MSDIVLNIGGTNYSGWTSMDLTISMETLSGVFNLSLTDNIGATNKPVKLSPTVRPGQTCVVTLNGETVITGYIDKVTPLIDANTHTIIIQGRDKTGDLVDCSMTQPINQWKSLTIDQIITRICQPFGISVTTNASVGAPFENFVVEQGSSCFEIIQKLCYMRQLLAISDGKGGLLLTTAGTDTANVALVEGINIKAGQADYDFSQRFSQYLCKGQKQGDDFTAPSDNTEPTGSFEDSIVSRYRPLMIIAEGQANIQDCTQRAQWEGAIRRGKSQKLVITVNGWSQRPNTSLWGINKLVAIQSILLGVSDSLLISQCEFKLDENGELTLLTLTSPEAYTLNTTSLIKSGANQRANPYLTASG